MGWSEVAARSHARRLEMEGWLARYPMTRGDGSLFLATRTGIAVAGVPVRAAGPPAPTWWMHHCGVAWAAAWLTARGHEFSGARELLENGVWSGQISWRDRGGYREATHRPDLVAHRNGGHVALEIELAKKSAERLRAILGRHLVWRSVGATGGVVYVCRDVDGCRRIRTVGADIGFVGARHGLRVELLDAIKMQAVEAREANQRAFGFRRPAAHAVGHGG
jgi:hypothetical protein